MSEVVEIEDIQLPEGWVLAELADLAVNPKDDIVDGPFGSNLKASEYTDTGVPIVRLQNIKRNYFLDKNIKCVTPEKADQLSRHNFKPGDLLITKLGAPLGVACIAPKCIGEGIIVADLVRARLPEDQVDTKYITYLINSPAVIQKFKENTKGTTRPRVNLKFMRSLQLPIAPYEQQKRIVAKIEELFSHIDTGIEALKKAKQLLKQYRQSVLKAAVTGELTKEWRKQNNLSKESWQQSTIGEIASVQTGKTPKRSSEEYWENGMIPWLTSSATNEAFTHHADQFVTQAAVDSGLKLFESGTLLLAMYGEGKTRGQVTEITFQATCNQACAAIIVDEDKASRAFVRLRLYENYEQTRKVASGGNQPNLNLSKVRDISLPLPPLAEQHEIVSQVEQKFEAISRLENELETQKIKAEKNKQSVLASAFSGVLSYE